MRAAQGPSRPATLWRQIVDKTRRSLAIGLRG